MQRDRPGGDDATLASTGPGPATPPAGVSSTPANYILGAMIGRGGMGEVLSAHDPRIDRMVAVKRLRGEPDAEAISRFLREAKIQARLDHPAIVPVYDLGCDADGMPYFAMKQISGTTMAAQLASNASSQQRLLRAFVDVCHAIELAHTKRIVHRDLKPSNIMLGDFGEVYVLDWGVARVLDSDEEPRLSTARRPPTLETHTGQMLGTLGYMAPEQVRGSEIGPAADVYALGSILFEILAREPLHPRGEAAIASTLSGEVQVSPSQRQTARMIPPELDSACSAALADDPGNRVTARDLGERVQGYLDGDRDLEQRRGLATEQLAKAHASLAAGHRSDAVHAAGRAVALDPGSSLAAGLLTTLIVEAPPVVPPEIVAAAEHEENGLIRARSRHAFWLTLTFFLLTPFLPWIPVASVPLLIANYLAFAAMAVISFINWRGRLVPVGVTLAVQLASVIAISRITGPFIVTPMVIGMLMLSSSQLPWLNDRRWAFACWAMLLAGSPVILERIGMLAPTWSVTDAGIIINGAVFEPDLRSQTIGPVVGTVVLVVLMGMYNRAMVHGRRLAQRKLHVQAWHLRQLLPRHHLDPTART